MRSSRPRLTGRRSILLPAVAALAATTLGTGTAAAQMAHIPETDWRQAEGGPVRGVGQRVFLVGDDDVAVMELGELRFGA